MEVWHKDPICLPDLQGGEEEVGASTPEITQRVHHATDEEKLACTGMLGQTADIQEERGEPQCNKAPPKKQTVDKLIDDICLKDGMFQTLHWVLISK